MKMKKLMFAMIVAAAAFAANAAAVTWQVSNLYTPTAGNLSPYTSDTKLSSAANVALELFWATSADGTWNSLTTGSLTGDGAMSARNAFNDTSVPSGMGSNPYFKAVVTYTDSDSKVYTLELFPGAGATGASANASDISNLANSNVALKFYGVNTSTKAGKTWATAATPEPEPIPEPTSGLLMLVGLGALALRRRRA